MSFDTVFGAALLGGLGIVLLILSSQYLVKKLLSLAHHYGVSDTFVGLTVLSISTSLPEIGSHIIASLGILRGTLDYKIASSTVLGANIGSDVVQQTLVLGLVILIIGKLSFTKRFLYRSYAPMVGTTLMCLILGWDGTYSRIDGAVLFGSFLAYVAYLYRSDERVHNGHPEPLKHPIWAEGLLTLAGMTVLLFGSSIALRSAEFVVEHTALSGSLIGVVTLGVASALPEMFTAIAGAHQNAKGISVGTLIGSNITNPLAAIGLGSLISTYYVPRPLVLWDLPMETVSALLLLIWLLFTKKELKKAGAVYLILLYAFYLFVRMQYFGID